jgi:hypothetical protein
VINQKLAARPGAIGNIFKPWIIGQRQYSQHSMLRLFRVVNYFWMMGYQTLSMMRTPFSRFSGLAHSPLNYSAIFVYAFCSGLIMSRFRFIRARDVLEFNRQDNPEFWYARYNMMFPPQFLHNRISAHYIEINHIFAVEMIKRYQVVRREVIAARDQESDETRRTKYATNPNYVYEPLGPDDDRIQRCKDDGQF